VEDEDVRRDLLALFPDGCYVAFAGDVYCEARNEGMDDYWRVLHALPGDGQNRPSVGDSLVQVQERYNVLSNMQAETYEYGIPPIYADPQVLDFDALANQVAEPAAHFPARARPGQPLAAGFFQPAPAQVPPDMVRHQQDLIGPVAQFLTGLFPAIFGGNMEDVRTASGYALARDQAMGRLGLVWRRLKQFYGEVMLLGVECFRKNRPEDVDVPLLGPDGMLDAQMIRVADLKGNICVHPEADETFPRLKSQQRGVLQQLFGLKDPLIQEALAEPANIGYVKNVLGLTELVVPGEDSRNKQLREIQVLLAGRPIVVEAPSPEARIGTGQDAQTLPGSLHSVAGAPYSGAEEKAGHSGRDDRTRNTVVLPSVPVDLLLDNHAVEFEECKRWANSEAGQSAKMTNPAGFANVRAHAEAHLRAMMPAVSADGPASLMHEPQAARRTRVNPPPAELHTTSTAVPQRLPGKFSSRGDADREGPGDHVLIHEPQGKQNQETPQSLAAQIPCDVRAAIARALNDSNGPTADDKKGGFHEEYGVAGRDASGKWVISRDKPGPYANPDTTDHVSPSGKAADRSVAYSIVDPRVAFHVHPGGTTARGKTWVQPPSDKDKAAAIPGTINIVFGARDKTVYFYNSSGVIGKPMKLKDFLGQ
jgi:hypothetical protein